MPYGRAPPSPAFAGRGATAASANSLGPRFRGRDGWGERRCRTWRLAKPISPTRRRSPRMPAPSPICSCAGTTSRTTATSVDVVVFLHGFSQSGGAMPLAEKIERSGLILSGRARPTLAMLPRGNWIRHYYYDFPALLDGGIDLLLAYGLHRLSEDARLAAGARPLHPRRAFGRRHAGDRRHRRRPGAARRALYFRWALRPRPGTRRPAARDRDRRPLARRALRRRTRRGPARCACRLSKARPARSRARSPSSSPPASTPPTRRCALPSPAATGSRRRACSIRRSRGWRCPNCSPPRTPRSTGTRRRPL